MNPTETEIEIIKDRYITVKIKHLKTGITVQGRFSKVPPFIATRMVMKTLKEKLEIKGNT